MKKTLFFDSTLRDGSHAIGHQLTQEQIERYCRQADKVGMHTVIVGHGNGLGASSLQVGISRLSDLEMLQAARRNLVNTKLGIFLIPGFGTIQDDLLPAFECGVDLACVAAHCTEADVTRQHIEFVRGKGKEVYGILMMSHMTSPERLLEEAQKMQSYGVAGVVLMDSAGAYTPEMVEERVSMLVNDLAVRVGFHAHNNLSLAVANSYVAIKCGATIIDGTLRGFGAGAGNCALEVLAGLLFKQGYKSGLDLYKIMDLADEVAANIMKKPQEISSSSLISGIAGVFSAFLLPVQKAAVRFNVDVRDIFLELGRRKVVGGQEDMIIKVADELAQRKEEQNKNYEIETLT